MAKISQQKAKMLVRDYITATGGGGVTEFMKRLTEFHSFQPFDERTLRNWLKGQTQNLNSGNWKIVSDFLHTEVFERVVPWGKATDNKNSLRDSVSDFVQSESTVNKWATKIASENHQEDESNLVTIFRAQKPKPSEFEQITGYWEVQYNEEHCEGKINLRITQFAKTTIGKFVIIVTGIGYLKIFTGVLYQGTTSKAGGASYNGYYWQSHDSDLCEQISIVSTLAMTSTQREFFVKFLQLFGLDACKRGFCHAERWPEPGGDIKYLIDLNMESVLPHHG
jgi:hypothetical protein